MARQVLSTTPKKARGATIAQLWETLNARFTERNAARGVRMCKRCSRKHRGRECPTKATSYGTRAHPDLVPLLEARLKAEPIPRRLMNAIRGGID